MRQYLSKILGLTAIVVLSGTFSFAQDKKEKLGENDEIIIRKDGDRDTKVTVEIKDGMLSINGKPYSEYNGDQVIIRRRRNADDMTGAYGVPVPPVPPAPPGSPFRGGVWNLDEDDFRRNFDSDRPFLGVLSEKDENGAKITGVTKESAAEKAGLKEGDVITAVNDIKISGPEDLIKTISTFKPDEKITITYNSRDKKGQKAGVVLGKRKGTTMTLPREFEGMQDFNFDFDSPGREGFSFRSPGAPRLGIKAQDLEEGNGAKVLEVDEESNAEKAGIKAGDIITEFEGEKIDGARELAEAARKNRDKSSVTLKINRGGKSQSIEVKLPKKLRTATL